MLAKLSATATCDRHAPVTTVLALVTLGSTTSNRNYPMSAVPPRMAKASISWSMWRVTVASVITLTFANVNTNYRGAAKKLLKNCAYYDAELITN